MCICRIYNNDDNNNYDNYNNYDYDYNIACYMYGSQFSII